MKRAFLFILFIIPTLVFSQITVVDGPDIGSDIDSQSSTTLYTGGFTADASIWAGYDDPVVNYKFYVCELRQQGNPLTLMGITYPGGISTDIPEVPYFVDITDTDLFENTDGNYDQFEPGATYYLKVTAYVATPDLTIVAEGESDGVLILGGEEPEEDGAAGAGRISLSASPSSLVFSAGESSKSLAIDIRAFGTGTCEITSIREDRIYPEWGEDRGFTGNIDLQVSSGFTESLNRTVELNALDRAKALGSGTEGSFTLRYVVSGQDAWGNPISATLNVPALVSGAPPVSLEVRDLSLELPDSPYFRGESVINSRITIEAIGSGSVLGQVYVDGSLGWTGQPAFAATVNGTTVIEIEAELPTAEPGLHTVRVELINFDGYSTESTYSVSAEEPPFPPAVLTLVPQVAELSGFSGTAEAQNINGGVQYTFNGSASLKILSMDNLVLSQADVNGLVVQYMNNAPNVPVIAGGFVEKEGAGQTIAEAAGGYVRVGRVAWQWAAEGSSLNARSSLFIPRLDTEVVVIPEMPITADGLELVGYSWDKNDSKDFDAFGVRFRLHDVNQNRALAVIEDQAADRYGFSFSGSIAWNEKEGMNTEEKELVSFTGITFYTDGGFEGGITVSEDFDLIPDILTITEAGLELEDDELAFKLRGQIKNLPAPFDAEGMSTTFALRFDTAGNVLGGLVPIDELSGGGQGISEDDATEWDFGFATVDLTYLGLDLVINQGTLNRDHSKVVLGADIYLTMLSGEGNRISFGSITVGAAGGLTLTEGLEISFDGDVVWPSMEGAINLVSGKSLDLGAVAVSLDNLALQYGDGNFAFLFSGSFRLKVEAVEGGISFVNLRIGLNGDMGAPEIQGTDLKIMDFVSVRVNEVNWGSGAISYTEDQTIGEGTNRQPAVGDEPAVIEVDNYFEILGASINIGSGDSSIMSGGFEQFLFYSIEDEVSFVLREARMEVSGCELFADIKYDRTYLRVAGGITMQQISGAAVGKIGVIPDTALDGTPEPRAGEPTLGLFVMVEGLGIMVAPSVFLDSVGGGVFINPTNEDISTVLAVTGFNRPELDDDIADMRPAGGGDPGGFAVMLLAGVYVAERTLVQGEALITLTANYFSLDAQVTALEGMLHGRSYFLISWNPWYAEGNNVLQANLFDIFTIDGDLAFYAYGSDAWGIMGGVNVALMGADIASGSFFIGPPGFMVETTVKTGVDIGFVSGYVQFSGMVWFYVVPDPDTWGAWADVEVGGSLLWGLVSAKAGVEGALIGQGTDVLIYAVGRVHFKACWVTVYKGSLWVSIRGNDIDGGKGRNDAYDQLIEDARNMAEEMESAKADLVDALSEAMMSLYQLNEEQRQAAGLALVDRSGWVGNILAWSFAAAEVESWPGALPNELQEIQEMLFGDEGQAFVDLRTELEQIWQDLNEELADLQELQNEVLARLEEYEEIVLEDLPNIRDLSTTGNPIQGMETATVPVGTGTRTVQVGFNIDEAKFEQQKQEMEGMRGGFAEYQDAFIQRAGLLDSKLQRLDEILFESEQSFTALMERYSEIHNSMVDYIERYIRFQLENAELATENLQEMQYTEIPDEIAGSGSFVGITSAPTEQVLRELMGWTAASLSANEIREWNIRRVALINLLIEAQGGEADYSIDEANIGTPRGFIDTGMELWWYLPKRGWELTIGMSEDRITSSIDSFHQSSTVIRESWATATGISDTVFDRKADLYALLYEIYDKLAVYGTGSMPSDANSEALQMRDSGAALAGRTPGPRVIGDEKTAKPFGEIGDGVPVSDYFESRRGEIAPYLELPEIELMDGELVSGDQYSAFFRTDFEAGHPVGVVEYAVKIHPFGYDEPWRSTGMQTSTADVIFQAYRIQRDYQFDLRARGAGGLSTHRRGDIEMHFFDPEDDAEPFVSSLDISDDSIPSWPVVTLAESITSNPEELYAEWSAIDPESGIRKYEYAVGTFSAPEGTDDAVMDNGDNGVIYLPGFGSALEPAGEPGYFGGGGDDLPDVPTDVLPWTDAGGRTAALIKNLDLQHGHEYVVSVRVTNGVGLRNLHSSDPVLVDLTPPEGQAILQLVQETVDEYPNSIRFEYSFAEEPETEIVAHYMALGRSPAADDLFPWTEMGLDFGRVANLPLAEGETFYLSIKAANSVGLESTVSEELEFSFNDATPPPAPMVLTSPQQNSTDGSQLSIGWNGVSDEESGIVKYAFGISSMALNEEEWNPDILDWVEIDVSEPPYYLGKGHGASFGDLPPPGAGDAGQDEAAAAEGGMVPMGPNGAIQIGDPLVFDSGLDTEYAVTRTGLNLQGRVYAVVRVTNGAGLSSVSASIPVIFDSSPPDSVRLLANSQQYRTDQLSCRLEASDRQSGIQAYRYSVFRVLGGPVQQWVSSEWIAVESTPEGGVSLPIRIRNFPAPGLEYGREYRIDFEVKNGTGLQWGAAPVIIELVRPKEGDLIQLDERQDSDGRIPGVRRVR